MTDGKWKMENDPAILATSLILPVIEPDICEQTLCGETAFMIEHVAVGDYDTTAVSYEAGFGHHAAFADG